MDLTNYLSRSTQNKYLKGKDLGSAKNAVISGVEMTEFEEGTPVVQLSVKLEGESEEKSFAIGVRKVQAISEKFGNNTDKWIGRKVLLVPTPSQTPDGTATTTIVVSPLV